MLLRIDPRGRRWLDSCGDDEGVLESRDTYNQSSRSFPSRRFLMASKSAVAIHIGLIMVRLERMVSFG